MTGRTTRARRRGVSEDDELGANDDKYDAGAAPRAAHQLLASEYAPHQAAGR